MLKTFRIVLIGTLSAFMGVNGLHAQSNQQIAALVEALKQAAGGKPPQNSGLYSDWLVVSGNIPRWTKSCLGRELTPAQFDTDATAVRQTVTCVITDVFKAQYSRSGKTEDVAVRRVAAWWMTGDGDRFDQGETAAYTEKVLNFYQKQRSVQAASPAKVQAVEYDQSMRLGYQAAQRKDYKAALQHFQAALKQKPGDRYAQKAIENVQKYIQQAKANAKTPQPSPAATTQPTPAPQAAATPEASITQQQAIDLINQWLQAKPQIFAPPHDRQLIAQFTTGELYTDLSRPNGILNWLQTQQAYYRYGVQKIESVDKFVAAGPKATLEVDLTEDRTLYRQGKVEAAQTSFQTQRVRYSLQLVDKQWKIADYKTAEGLLLERSIP